MFFTLNLYLEIVYYKGCSHLVASWQQSCAIKNDGAEIRTGATNIRK